MVWGTQTQQDWIKWDKHPTEILYAEFCKSILWVQRRAPNSPNVWNNIKTSDLLSFFLQSPMLPEAEPTTESPQCNKYQNHRDQNLQKMFNYIFYIPSFCVLVTPRDLESYWERGRTAGGKLCSRLLQAPQLCPTWLIIHVF